MSYKSNMPAQYIHYLQRDVCVELTIYDEVFACTDERRTPFENEIYWANVRRIESAGEKSRYSYSPNRQ